MADQKRRWKEKSARYVSTLVYMDEPQVVLLDHGDDAKIIGVAIEKKGFEYPFLGAEVSFSQWERYRRQFVDLRYLFLLPKWRRWFIFDLACQDADDMIPLQRAGPEDYRNNAYLPSHGFFARDHTEDESEFAATAEIISQRFTIDGTWDPPDISQFFARINDLYSFFLGIRKFLAGDTTHEQKRALVEVFTENTLHSGFNYVNFYTDLKGLIGFDERLAMPAIVKQSPGFVDVEGKAVTLREVSRALDTFDSDQEALKTQYNQLHGYLSKAKLLKAGADRLERSDAMSKYIREQNQKLAQLLRIDHKPIDRLTGQNALLTAKILLSYHRRLERYHLFFVEGRVKAGGTTPTAVANSPSIDGTPDA
jgi:hypothetical protein